MVRIWNWMINALQRMRPRPAAFEVSDAELRELERLVWQSVLLNDSTRRTMIGWSKRFIAGKNWEGCEGFVIHPHVQRTVALNASLLVLAYPDWSFPSTQTVLIYPRPYKARSRGGDLHSGLGGEFYRAGETRARGPIVLNWRDIELAIDPHNDGDHLILHEFAHQLDMIDDPNADGVPPLPESVEAPRWKREFMGEFEAARAAVERGNPILINDYGLTHPSEFFAVASECYFQIPRDLREYHPRLYGLLREFYITDLAQAMDERERR